MDAGPQAIMYGLQGRLIRTLALRGGRHFQGLAQTGRAMKAENRLSGRIARRLVALDCAYNTVRHITEVSAQVLLQAVVEELSVNPAGVEPSVDEPVPQAVGAHGAEATWLPAERRVPGLAARVVEGQAAETAHIGAANGLAGKVAVAQAAAEARWPPFAVAYKEALASGAVEAAAQTEAADPDAAGSAATDGPSPA